MQHARQHGATDEYRIDLHGDDLIPLALVKDWHERRTGQLVHRTVPYGWARRGVAGVRLPTIQIGGVRFTSREALSWWTAAVQSRMAEGRAQA